MTTIPEKYIELGKELAVLAKKYHLRGLAGHIKPGEDWQNKEEQPWRYDITFNWVTGRHGDAEREIKMSTTVQLEITTSYTGETKITEW